MGHAQLSFNKMKGKKTCNWTFIKNDDASGYNEPDKRDNGRLE